MRRPLAYLVRHVAVLTSVLSRREASSAIQWLEQQLAPAEVHELHKQFLRDIGEDPDSYDPDEFRRTYILGEDKP